MEKEKNKDNEKHNDDKSIKDGFDEFLLYCLYKDKGRKWIEDNINKLN